ncbi:MAG: hypothetical protein GY856_36245 [bacterium]|nr:hypothetical protein [bacterium]
MTVTPASNVTTRIRGETTQATANVPLTRSVAITWAEAVPEEIRTEVRANAGLYHLVFAEEGVLYVRVLVDYEITRGETNVLRLEVPPEVQVNRISSPSGAVADWRIAAGDGARGREATVFFDRQLQGNLVLEVLYDGSVGPAGDGGRIEVPLLRALDTQRQRGMVALLASKELTLKPLDDAEATRVGENQLPAFVRQAIEMTVAHTYKYVEALPRLVVEISTPERQEGRFDAQVDTLISLGEVSLKGSASVELNVKSGRIMELRLALPGGVNLLSLTGPSIRNHTVDDDEGEQWIDVQFTQEMEGQFRLEVAYEQILLDSESELFVPTVAVNGAEVEQGRLAVEALSAVEVQPATIEQLTSLDINELPQQLILRTTNPILMAYKYVHAEPPYRLGLTVTRHEVLDVLDAAIDQARYRTLFTKDGLAVTTAHFVMRNSREQFLRIELPDRAEVWSVFVDGNPEKPAQAAAGEEGTKQVLIKIIHSTEGFPVELIYQMPSARIHGILGSVRGELPRPDILVTHSRWDVYLPPGVVYREPDTNMEVLESGIAMTAEAVAAEQARLEAAAVQQAIEPLRLTVPTSGTHYAFEKLYANQTEGEAAYFEIPYASGAGTTAGWMASLLGTAILWLGVALVLRRRSPSELRLAIAAVVAGVLVIVLMLARYHVGATAVVIGSILAVALGYFYGKPLWDRRSRRAGGEEAEGVEEAAAEETAEAEEEAADEEPEP